MEARVTFSLKGRFTIGYFQDYQTQKLLSQTLVWCKVGTRFIHPEKFFVLKCFHHIEDMSFYVKSKKNCRLYKT